ncbi:MAG: hypothetical protein JWO98_1082 [Frankiales bacterium]|nr:hypothetical protein [Frankiales bacterium]
MVIVQSWFRGLHTVLPSLDSVMRWFLLGSVLVHVVPVALVGDELETVC